jgi:hypothetical protein
MAVRKKLSKKDAKNFTDKKVKPVAKKKLDRKAGDEHTKKISEQKRPNAGYVDHKQIGGASLRGMMQETMARCYSEMFPTMTTHQAGTDEVDLEIQEEAYILGLTMVCGTDDYLPRRGLKIREKAMPVPRYCKEHRA